MQKGEILRTVTKHYFKVPLSTAHRAHPVGEAGTVHPTPKDCQQNLGRSWHSLKSVQAFKPEVLPKWARFTKSHSQSSKCHNAMVTRNPSGEKWSSGVMIPPHPNSSQGQEMTTRMGTRASLCSSTKMNGNRGFSSGTAVTLY